jgi:serine O-acetyltransferase
MSQPGIDASTPEPYELDFDATVSGLRQVRLRWREASGRSREPSVRELPAPEVVAVIVDHLCGLLFPMRLGPPELRPLEEDFYVRRTLETSLKLLQAQIRLELAQEARARALAPHELLELHETARQLAHRFGSALPALLATLDSDIAAAFQGQAGPRNVDEILLCSPGVRALLLHRIAHQLHKLGAPLVSRMVADLAHSRTGIDIHPAAQIGAGCFIHHGTGLVVGEGVRIGKRVCLHQNVTLDTSDGRGLSPAGAPRYPTLEDEVIVHPGTTILDGVTIGQGAVIGGHLWITENVPPFTHLTQAGHSRTGR